MRWLSAATAVAFMMLCGLSAAQMNGSATNGPARSDPVSSDRVRADPVRADLERYLTKPDASYGYTHYATDDEHAYRTYFLSLRSQQWREAGEVDRPVWEHTLSITVPAGLESERAGTALLVIAGGSNADPPLTQTEPLVAAASLLGGLVVAVVRQVPNQPLSFLDEQPPRQRSEDALLAYSMARFLDSCGGATMDCDHEWPVQVAMTKAAVRAMDAVQAFLGEQNVAVRDFIVTGASKRGWAAWLTAAVDARVRGLAPVSADLLRLPDLAARSWASYGGSYSPPLQPYVEFDLFCRAVREPAAGVALWRIVDPYAYRARLDMPKLIVNSAGDEFFLPDGSRLYMEGLPGENRLRYTFNTDHAQSGSELETLGGVMEWVADMAAGQPIPDYHWDLAGDRLRVRPAQAPHRVWLWRATDVADPSRRDFRLATLGPAWIREPLHDPDGDGVYEVELQAPETGWTAYSVQVQFSESGLLAADQIFTTDVVIRPASLPLDPGHHCRED